MSSLKFYVREDDSEFGTNVMSGQEWEAIANCVNDLICGTETNAWGDIWVEAERPDDDDATYGLLVFYTPNPAPKNGSWGESRVSAPIPSGILTAFGGKTFSIQPPQYGLSPWGEKVEITFE
jgi:hypothetical protein